MFGFMRTRRFENELKVSDLRHETILKIIKKQQNLIENLEKRIIITESKVIDLLKKVEQRW